MGAVAIEIKVFDLMLNRVFRRYLVRNQAKSEVLIEPESFLPHPEKTKDAGSVELPRDLPEPVRRYYEAAAGSLLLSGERQN